MRSLSINPIIECGHCRRVLFRRYKLTGKSLHSITLPLHVFWNISRRTFSPKKMAAEIMRFAVGFICVAAVLLSLVEFSEANYKNAPMNGIMFGKRGPTDYDSRGKTFTALCEIATEACQAWFPSQETK